MKSEITFLILALVFLFTQPLMAKVYEQTSGNKLTLIEDPVLSVDHKVELINHARHHVHIVTFFWDDSTVPSRLSDALNRAHARGVEVRILTSFIPTLTTDILGKGRRHLDINAKGATFSYFSLMPGPLFSFTSNLHEKIFIVDGEKAIIGGRNVSDSSLSGKDVEVEMEGPVVNEVQDHFKGVFDFLLAQKMEGHCQSSKSTYCEDGYKKMQFSRKDSNFFPTQPTFSEGDEARILTNDIIFHQAQGLKRKDRQTQPDDILDTVTKIDFKKLRAYNYFMLPTKRYQDFLEKNLALGNSIDVITNSMESATFSNNLGYFYGLPESLSLVNQGLELYQWQKDQKYNYVHEKVLIFDDERALIGSHNFVVGSTAVSNEIMVDIKSKSIVGHLIEVFDHEKNTAAITQKAEASLLTEQNETYKKKIKYLRTKPLADFLREMY
jgi:putative cardiolipin synthase